MHTANVQLVVISCYPSVRFHGISLETFSIKFVSYMLIAAQHTLIIVRKFRLLWLRTYLNCLAKIHKKKSQELALSHSSGKFKESFLDIERMGERKAECSSVLLCLAHIRIEVMKGKERSEILHVLLLEFYLIFECNSQCVPILIEVRARREAGMLFSQLDLMQTCHLSKSITWQCMPVQSQGAEQTCLCS
jgi:hypothetical protein